MYSTTVADGFVVQFIRIVIGRGTRGIHHHKALTFGEFIGITRAHQIDAGPLINRGITGHIQATIAGFGDKIGA
ncbi:hypothetical protein D3C87_1827190 [compost metagenome]